MVVANGTGRINFDRVEIDGTGYSNGRMFLANGDPAKDINEQAKITLRCLHPQPCHRRKEALWRIPDQRPGRGRGGWRAHPHAHRGDGYNLLCVRVMQWADSTR